ncbi:hypothetical protein EDC96DRAFT_591005 [Choanephora cucurbitarum]|nr:hypothetical protein EDC96DRAFT_591005 [Choanephora cucurbitarum]
MLFDCLCAFFHWFPSVSLALFGSVQNEGFHVLTVQLLPYMCAQFQGQVLRTIAIYQQKSVTTLSAIMINPSKAFYIRVFYIRSFFKYLTNRITHQMPIRVSLFVEINTELSIIGQEVLIPKNLKPLIS